MSRLINRVRSIFSINSKLVKLSKRITNSSSTLANNIPYPIAKHAEESEVLLLKERYFKDVMVSENFVKFLKVFIYSNLCFIYRNSIKLRITQLSLDSIICEIRLTAKL